MQMNTSRNTLLIIVSRVTLRNRVLCRLPPRFPLYLRIDKYVKVSRIIDTFDFVDQHRLRKTFDEYLNLVGSNLLRLLIKSMRAHMLILIH